MHQYLAIILQQLYYSKISFLVLVPLVAIGICRKTKIGLCPKQHFSQKWRYLLVWLGHLKGSFHECHCSGDQCDQIWVISERCQWHTLFSKVAHIYMDLLGYFEKHDNLNKFWATFGKIGPLFSPQSCQTCWNKNDSSPNDVVIVLGNFQLQFPQFTSGGRGADGLPQLLPTLGRHLLRSVHCHLRELHNERC